MDTKVKKRVERLLKAAKLKKRTAKKLKQLKRESVKRDKLDSHELFCSVCGDIFQKRHFDDYREHMAMHEAVDFIWGLKSEELYGSFNNLTPETVKVTPEQYKLYIDGRKTQIIKELKETAEYEAGVRFRQNGGRTGPVPAVEIAKRLPANFPKIIMPASKPTLPRPPVARHMTPNRPYFGAPFTIKPAVPAPKHPGPVDKCTLSPAKEPTSDANLRPKVFPIIQVPPNNPYFGRPPKFGPLCPHDMTTSSKIVTKLSPEQVVIADAPITPALASRGLWNQKHILPSQRPPAVFPNPGAPKMVRSVVPVRANNSPYSFKKGMPRFRKDGQPVKMFEGMPVRPNSGFRLTPPLLHPMGSDTQTAGSASSSTASTSLRPNNGLDMAENNNQSCPESFIGPVIPDSPVLNCYPAKS